MRRHKLAPNHPHFWEVVPKHFGISRGSKTTVAKVVKGCPNDEFTNRVEHCQTHVSSFFQTNRTLNDEHHWMRRREPLLGWSLLLTPASRKNKLHVIKFAYKSQMRAVATVWLGFSIKPVSKRFALQLTKYTYIGKKLIKVHACQN